MGYRRILAVVSEHSSSTVAARYAIAMAASAGAELVLYSAHVAGENDDILLNTERHIDHLFTAAFNLGVPVTRITEVGALSRHLPKRVLVEQVSLVLYSLPPHEHYGAMLQDEAVHRLLRTIKADMAIMRIVHMAKPQPRHILVPLGGRTADHEQRADFIAELARSFHSRITLFHRAAPGMPASPEDLVLMGNVLKQHHLPVQERSASGHIAKAIALEAISRHHDLIVLGASERGALRRLFFGNPAGDVMRQPPCNAILFRAALP